MCLEKFGGRSKLTEGLVDPVADKGERSKPVRFERQEDNKSEPGMHGQCGDAYCRPRRISIAERRRDKKKKKEMRQQHYEEAEKSEVMERTARETYEDFHDLSRGTATLAQVVKTSAGIEGWAASRNRIVRTSIYARKIEPSKTEPSWPSISVMTKPMLEKASQYGVLLSACTPAMDGWEMSGVQFNGRV